MSRASDSARLGLDELVRVGAAAGWKRFYFALVADRHVYPGGPLRVVTLHEMLPLTCGLFRGLEKSDVLFLGRYGAQLYDRTPWDWEEDYDETSPVTALELGVCLTAEAGSILTAALLTTQLTSLDEELGHLLFGALRRPEGWPP